MALRNGLDAVVTLVLVANLAGSALADDDGTSRASLKGVPGVCVKVVPLEPSAATFGLSEGQLRTDAELRLRHHGIRVVSDDEMKDPQETAAYLTVQVTHLVFSNGDLVVFSISVEAIQGVLLPGGQATAATTWSVGSLGALGRDLRPARGIRERALDRVDEFANAYLSVNPRPPEDLTPRPGGPGKSPPTAGDVR